MTINWDNLTFKFARTMPQIPHEYVVRTPENEADYVALHSAIEQDGTLSEWRGTPRLYWYPGDGWKYWNMGDLEQSRVINRARVELDATGGISPTYEAMRLLHWGPADLRSRLGINERTVRRMLQHKVAVPPQVIDWLNYLSAPLMQAPPDFAEVGRRLEEQPVPVDWTPPVEERDDDAGSDPQPGVVY